MEEPLRDPGIPDGETTRYRALIDGEETATGALIVERTDAGYRERIEGEIGDTRFDLEMTFGLRNGFLQSEHYRLDTTYDGRPVAREEGWFRDVKTLQFGGRLKPYPRSVTPLLGCALALRGLDFVKGERATVALWLANSVWWEVALRVERGERITTPAGTADAWRVRARPSFEQVNRQLDRVIGLFLPPFVLHFDREPPHPILRFEFPTGPFPWDPRAVIEATER